MRVLTSFEQRAKDYATEAHGDQITKYGNEPYINHSAAVVEILSIVTNSRTMLAAGWLHDVVEDTDKTLDDIYQRFGYQVASLVSEVTNASMGMKCSRALRKSIDRGHLSKASHKGKTLKLADVIVNTMDIVAKDPKFATIYLSEKWDLLGALAGGNTALYLLAEATIIKSGRLIGLDFIPEWAK